MMRTSDAQFTTFLYIALVQAQIKHDASLFDTVCTNIRNDIQTLNVYIKELRKSVDEGKKLYGKCTMSCNYLSEFDDLIKGRMSELQIFTIRLQQPDASIEDIEVEMKKVHNAIRGIEFEKDKVIKRFFFLREYLAPKFSIL